MSKRVLLIVSILIILPALIYAAVTDYLILQDIGSYKLFTTIFPEDFKGPLPKYSQTATGGVLAAAGHFSEGDVSYEASYTEPSSKWPFVTVEVTKHANSDSDKWLLHEVDREFRNYYGIPGKSYGPRQISGQTIIENLVAGGSYRWISGTKVIVIEYHDSQMTKPEPVEVIQAYLTKHPSTMQAFTLEDLRSAANKTTWIKDEMDRRLWLCDKWFLQLTLKKAEENQVYQESVRSMNIFLDYREKYYGLKATDEKNLLAGYLNSNNGTSIKAKLAEYKNWWSIHKTDAISLP
jgi:hypothetical protein